MAYYPHRIRQFPIHRNNLDDIDASHVNNLQDEVGAIMQALGESPHVYNDVQTDTEIPVAIPPDDGTSTDNDLLFTSQVRYYDPKIKPYNHGSVGARLDNIERGKQFHAFRLGGSNFTVGSRSVAFSTRPQGLAFRTPAASNDPIHMYNGVGVTLRKAGFWVFTSNVLYSLQGTTANSNNGIYQAGIEYVRQGLSGNWTDSLVRDQETGSNKAPSLNPILMAFLPVGTRVSLRTSHNSGRNQKVSSAYLAGVCLRENI